MALALDIGIDFTGANLATLGGARGGGVLSSTNSGLTSGGAGGGGTTISSGGGVGSGVSWIVASTISWAGSERFTGGASRFMAATTAPRWIRSAAPRAVQRCHLGGGR